MNKPALPRRLQRRAPRLERLEQRLMFDGAAVETAVEAAEPLLADAAAFVADIVVPAAVTEAGETRQEIAFVDTAIDGYDAIVEAIPGHIDVVLVAAGDDGLALLASQLEGRTGVDAIHVFGHGSEGSQQLGSAVLDASTLSDHADLLARLGAAMSEQGDLLLYGCHVGSAEGRLFVDSLASLSAADIAASTDATGSAAAGGDWDLEYTSGPVEAATLLAAVPGFEGLLAAPSVTGATSLEVNEDTAQSFAGLQVTAPDNPNMEAVATVTSGEGSLRTPGVTLDSIAVQGDLAALNNFLDTLEFVPDTDWTGTATVRFFFESDFNNRGETTEIDVTISVLPVNDAPTATGGVITIDEDTAHNFTVGDFGFADAADDPADALVEVLIDTLPLSGVLTLDGSPVDAGDVIGVAAIPDLVYTPAANVTGAGQASFSFRLRDDGGTERSGVDTSAGQSLGFTMTPVNDAPQASDVSDTTNKNTDLVFSLSGFDVDDGTNSSTDAALVGFTITSLPANGILFDSQGAEITAIDGSVNVLSVAQATGIVFRPASNYTGPASFEFRARDAADVLSVETASVTITVAEVNEGPAVTVPDETVNVAEDASVPVTGVSVADGDAGSNLVELELLVTHGTLTLADLGGLYADADGGTPLADGSGASLSVYGSVADLNSALAQLSYTPAPDYFGSDTLTVTIDDLGFSAGSGPGTPLQDSATLDISVAAVPDAPTTPPVTLAAIVEDQATVDGARVADLLASAGFNDVDGDALAGVAISANPDNSGAGEWQYSLNRGATWTTIGSVSADAALLLPATAYLRFLPELDYSGTPQPLTVHALDDSGSRSFTTDSASPVTIDSTQAAADLDTIGNTLATAVTAANDPLRIVNNEALPVVEGNRVAGVPVAGSIAVLTTTVLQVTDAEAGPGDIVFEIQAAGTQFGDGALQFDSTGSGDWVAIAAGDIFRQENIDDGRIRYVHNGAEPSGDEQVSLTVTDLVGGLGSTESLLLPLQVSPLNDVPDITQSTINVPILGSADFSELTVIDPDNLDTQLRFELTSLPDPAVGFITIDGRPVAVGSLFTYSERAQVRFTSVEDAFGSTTFTVTLRDGAGGVVPGDTQLTIVVGEDNQAPDRLPDLSLPAILEDGDSYEGAFAVANDGDTLAGYGALPTDPDAGDAVVGIAVVGNTAPLNQGEWQYSTNDGASWRGIGTVNDSGAALIIPIDARLRFAPVADYAGAPPDLLLRMVDGTYTTSNLYSGSFSASDGAQAYVDTSGRGDEYAVSGGDPTALSISVTAVNDDPVLDANAGLRVDSGGSGTISTSLLDVDDIDSPDSAITYTLTGVPDVGELRLNGVALLVGDTFTQADINANRLTFADTAPSVDGSTTSFSFTVTDAAQHDVYGRDGGIYDGSGPEPQSVLRVITFDILIDTQTVDPDPADARSDYFTIPWNTLASPSSLGVSEAILLSNDDGSNRDITAVAGLSDSGSISTTHGVLTWDNASGLLTYVPDQDFTGTDSFSYTLTSDEGSDTATVVIYVRSVEATQDVFTIDWNTTPVPNALTTSESALLVNDIGSNRTVTNVAGMAASGSAPTAHGVVSWNDVTGEIVYTPDEQYVGNDSFSYTISSDEGTSTGTVIVRVRASDIAPFVVNNLGLSGSEGSSVEIGSDVLRIDDLNPEDDAAHLRYTITGVDADFATAGVLYSSAPDGFGHPVGVLSVNDSFTQADIDAGYISFSHSGSEDLLSGFSFSFTDGEFTVSGQRFDIDFSAVNDAPVFSNPNTAQILEEGAYLDLSALLLATDSDGGGDKDPALVGTPPAEALAASNTLVVIFSDLNPLVGEVRVYDDASFDGYRVVAEGEQVSMSAVESGLVRYQHLGGEEIDDSFTVRVNDGSGELNAEITRAVSIVLIPVNDDPQVDVNTNALITNNSDGTVTISEFAVYEGASATLNNVFLGAFDPDNSATQLQFRIDDAPDHGVLALGANVLGVGSSFTEQQLIDDALRYVHDGSGTTADSFRFTLSDAGGGLEPGGTFEIDIVPVNDAPVLTLPAPITAVEDTSKALRGISISDEDIGAGSATVTLSVGNGILTLGSVSGLVFENGTGNDSNSLIVSGSVGDLNAALATLSYQSTLNFNSDDGRGDDTLLVAVTDNGNSGDDPDTVDGLSGDGNDDEETDSGSVAITVISVNDAPQVLTVPAAQTVAEENTLTFSGAAGTALSIDDIDAAPELLEVTLSVAHGVLTLADTTGLSFQDGTSNGAATLVFRGTQGDINTALDTGVSYRGETDFFGADQLAFLVDDLGNQGTIGGALQDHALVDISVTPLNDAPTAAAVSASAAEDGAATFTLDSADVDSGTDAALDARVDRYIIDTLPGNGTLRDGDGVAVNAGDTLSVAQAEDMTFTPDPNFNGTVSFLYRAQDAADAVSGQAAVTITVTPVNDAPLLSGGGDSVNYTEGDGEGAAGTPVFIDADGDVTVIDQELTQDAPPRATDTFDGSYLQIQRNGGRVATDVLRVGERGLVTVAGSAVSYDGALVATVSTGTAGRLTVVFNASATQDAVNAVARAITYASSADNQQGGVTLSLFFNDDNDGPQGSGLRQNSNSQLFTVDTINVNDRPGFDNDAAFAQVEDDTGAGGVTLSSLLGSAFTDSDAPVTPGSGFAGVVVVSDAADRVTEGYWQYSTDAGDSWHDVSPAGDAALADDGGLLLTATTLLRFQPVLDFNSAAPDADPGSLSVMAVDDSGSRTYTSGGSRQLVDTTLSPADIGTAVADRASVGVSLSQVNDAPEIRYLASSAEILSFTEAVGTNTAGAAVRLDSLGSDGGGDDPDVNTPAEVVDVELTLRDEAGFEGARLVIVDEAGADDTDLFVVETGGDVGVQGGFTVPGPGVILFNSGSAVTYQGSFVATITDNSADSGRLVITFNGSATPAAVNAILQRIAYSNDNDVLQTVSKTIGVSFYDGNGLGAGSQGVGGELSATASIQIGLQSSNDSPLLSAGALQEAVEADAGAATTATSVTDLLAANFSDPDGRDGNSLSGVLVTGFNNLGLGEWEVSLDGSSFVALSSLDDGTAIAVDSALALAADTQIRFSYAANVNTQALAFLPYIEVRGVEALAPQGAANTGAGQAAQEIQFTADFASEVRYDLAGDTSESRVTDTAVNVEASIGARNDAPVVSVSGTTDALYSNGVFAGQVPESPVAGVGTAPQALIEVGASIDVSDLDIATTADLDAFGGGRITVVLADRVVDDEFFLDGAPLAGVASESGGSGSSGDYVITLADDASTDQIEAILAAIRYQDTSDNPPAGTRAFTITLNDADNIDGDGDTAGGPTALDATALSGSITIVDQNNPPQVSATGLTPEHVEGSPPAALFSDAAVDLVDDGNTLTTLVLTVSAVSDGSEELLTIDGVEVPLVDGTTSLDDDVGSTADDDRQVVVSVDEGTATLTFTDAGGIDSATAEALIEALAYRNASEDATPGPRVVTLVSATDSGGGDDTAALAIAATVTVVEVNDAPVLTAGGTLSYTENAPAQVIDATLTVVGDVDDTQLAGATVSIVDAVAGDTLALTELHGISGSYDSDTGVLTLSGSASLLQYQEVLRSVTFASTSEDPTVDTGRGSRTIEWQVTDANSDGVGAASSVVVTSDIDITPTTDNPELTVSATATYTENGDATVLDGALDISDADDTQLTAASVYLTDYLEGDRLSADVGSTGLVASYASSGPDAGRLTITGTATLAAYREVLRSVEFWSDSDDPTVDATRSTRTVEVAVTDADSDAAGAGQAVETLTLTIVPQTDVPTFSAAPVAVDFTEQGGAVAVDAALTLADADDTEITGATVTISDGLQPDDLLAVTVDGTAISVDGYAGGVLTLSGTDTLANYQAVLQSLTFDNNSDNPTASGSADTRTLTYRVTDADSDAAGAGVGTTARTVNVIAVNDAPVIAGDVASNGYVEDSPPVLLVDGVIDLTDLDAETFAGGTLSVLLQGPVPADSYSQDFNAAMAGATEFGDGSILYAGHFDGGGSPGSNNLPPTAQVEVHTGDSSFIALRLIEDLGGSLTDQYATFVLPALNGGAAAAGFSATFDLLFADSAGAAADGIAFSYGALPATLPFYTSATAGAEETSYDAVGPVLSVSFDVYDNGGSDEAVQVYVDGVAVANQYTFEATPLIVEGSLDAAYQTVNVDWDGSNLTVSYGGTVLFSSIDVSGFTPESGARFVFSTRAGTGADLDTFVDNISVETAVIGGGSYSAGDTLLVLEGDGVTLSGNAVSYNGTQIATLSGGDEGVLSISFDEDADATAIEAVLGRLAYENSGDNPDLDGSRADPVVTIRFDDGGNVGSGPGSESASNTLSGVLSLTPVNDAPTLAIDASAYAENAAATPVDADVSFGDVDSTRMQGGSLVVSISADGEATDQLSILDGGSISVAGSDVSFGATLIGTITADGSNGGDLVVTFSDDATPAAIDALIQRIAYASTSEDPTENSATRTLRFTIVDGDGTDNGGADTVTATSLLTITASNDAPELAGTVGGTFTESDSPVVDALQFLSEISLSDVDAVQFSGGFVDVAFDSYVDGDRLVVVDGNGISVSGSTVSYDGGGGAEVIGSIDALRDGGDATPLRVNFSSTAATPAAVTALLGQVAFYSDSDNPTRAGSADSRAVTVTVNDGGNDLGVDGTGSAGEDSFSGSFAVVGINDAPAIADLDGSAATGYVQAGAPVVIDADATLADADLQALLGDVGNWEGATLVLERSGGASTDDVFSGSGSVVIPAASGSATVGGVVVGSVSNGSGSLSITFGANATTARVQTLLQSLRYANAVVAPGALAYDNVDLVLTLNDQNSNATDDLGGGAGGGQDQGSGGRLATSATINVDINRLPVMGSDVAGVDEGVATTDTSTVAGDVTPGSGQPGEDTDPDGDTLTVQGVAAGTRSGPVSGNLGLAVTGLYGSVTVAADGSYSYMLDNGNPVVQALASAETLTDTFSYTVDDGRGGKGTTQLTVTATGTNDAPEIGIGTGDSAAATAPESDSELTASGTVTVTDVDTTDVVTGLRVDSIVVSGDSDRSDAAAPGDDALKAMLSVAPATVLDGGTQSAQLTWTFDSDGETFDYLDAGDQLVLTYTLRATDDDASAAFDEQTVTITITGTNDTPTISGGGDSATVTETDTTLTTGGAFTVVDVDTPQAVDLVVDSVALSGSFTTSGSALPAGLAASDYQALRDMLVLAPDSAVAADSPSGTEVAWTFTSGDAGDDAFDFLREGEALTLTYTVLATDDSGETAEPASTATTVAVTVTGSNDTPLIGGGPDTATLAETDGTLTTTQTLTVADPDRSDTVSLSVTEVSIDASSTFGGTLPASLTDGGNAALLSMLSVPGGALAAQPDSPTAAAWTFTSGASGDAAFQFLADGETLVLDYTVTAADNSGGADTESETTVRIIITGSNDQPTVDVTSSVAVTESADASAQSISDSGTVSFADVDVTDRIALSAAYNGDLTWSGGMLPVGLEARTTAGTFTASASNLPVPGSSAWNYASAAADLDFLAAGETLTFSFDITASDGQGGTATRTVGFTITGSNDAPTLAPVPGGSIAENDQAATLATSGLSGTLAGDDADATDTLSYSIDGGTDQGATQTLVGSYGTLTVNEASGAYVFTPNAAAIEALDGGETTSDSFAVRVTDAQGASAVRAFTVNLSGADDAPLLAAVVAGSIAENDLSSTTTDSGLSGVLSASDVDIETLEYGISGGTDSGGSVSLEGDYGTLTVNKSSGAYSYGKNTAAIEALAEGQSVSDSFTVTVSDGDGAPATATYTVTVSGGNDAPLISVVAGDRDATTLAETNAGLVDTGTLTVADIDRADTVTLDVVAVTIQPGSTSAGLNSDAAALASMLSLSPMSPAPALTAGAVQAGFSWAFDSAGEHFDYLADGESLTLRYTLAATDSAAHTSNAFLDVTISGSNDGVSISVGAGDSAAATLVEGDAALDTAGTLTVQDADRSNTAAADVIAVASGGTTAGLGADNADLLSMLELGANPVLAADAFTGGISWSFDSGRADPAEAFDYLAAGESLQLTYTLRVDDSSSTPSSAEQSVEISVQGSNDAPQFFLDGGDNCSIAIVETGLPLAATGSVSLRDPDLSDTVSVAFTGVVASGDTLGLSFSDAELLAMISTGTTLVVDDTQTSDRVDWSFDTGVETFDFIAAGAELTLDYTLTATDATGATATQLVTLTIYGTNSGDSIVATPTAASRRPPTPARRPSRTAAVSASATRMPRTRSP
jgi:VCBS repeat-containing protein